MHTYLLCTGELVVRRDVCASTATTAGDLAEVPIGHEGLIALAPACLLLAGVLAAGRGVRAGTAAAFAGSVAKACHERLTALAPASLQHVVVLFMMHKTADFWLNCTAAQQVHLLGTGVLGAGRGISATSWGCWCHRSCGPAAAAALITEASHEVF